MMVSKEASLSFGTITCWLADFVIDGDGDAAELGIREYDLANRVAILRLRSLAGAGERLGPMRAARLILHAWQFAR